MLGREVVPLAEETAPTSMALPHSHYTPMNSLVKSFVSGRMGVWNTQLIKLRIKEHAGILNFFANLDGHFGQLKWWWQLCLV